MCKSSVKMTVLSPCLSLQKEFFWFQLCIDFDTKTVHKSILEKVINYSKYSVPVMFIMMALMTMFIMMALVVMFIMVVLMTMFIMVASMMMFFVLFLYVIPWWKSLHETCNAYFSRYISCLVRYQISSVKLQEGTSLYSILKQEVKAIMEK